MIFDFQATHDEQYNPERYIDSGFSHYMTGRKSQLKEFQSLKYVGTVKYGNSETGEIKGYGIITNG